MGRGSVVIADELDFGEEGGGGEGSLVADGLDVGAVVDEFASVSLLLVVKTGELGESPLVGDDESLSAGEFVLGSAEGLEGGLDVLLSEADGVDDSADFDSGGLAVALAESLSHSCLEPISASA